MEDSNINKAMPTNRTKPSFVLWQTLQPPCCLRETTRIICKSQIAGVHIFLKLSILTRSL